MAATYYVTKWWRTRGILIAGPTLQEHPGWVSAAGFAQKIGVDAFPTLEEAQARIRSQAANRAAALQREADRCRQIATGALVIAVVTK